MLFCPICGTNLLLRMTTTREYGHDGQQSFYCRSCPYVFNVDKPVIYLFSYSCSFLLKKKCKGKRLMMSWVELKNGKMSIPLMVINHCHPYNNYYYLFLVTCPKCEFSRAYYFQVQIRSADEPMSIFYKCCRPECSHQWREG